MGVYLNLLKGATAGEVWSFSVHTQKAGGTLAGASAAWAAAAPVLWNGTGATDSIGQYCKSTTTATDASTAEIDVLTGRQLGRIDVVLTLAGSGTSESLPPQVSAACSLRTALATRRGRGRFYLPPFVTDTDTGGLLDATVQGVVSLACQKFLQSLVTATYVPIIWHRDTKTYDNVVTIDVGNVFDTQRRRRNKLVETRSSRTL